MAIRINIPLKHRRRVYKEYTLRQDYPYPKRIIFAADIRDNVIHIKQGDRAVLIGKNAVIQTGQCKGWLKAINDHTVYETLPIILRKKGAKTLYSTVGGISTYTRREIVCIVNNHLEFLSVNYELEGLDFNIISVQIYGSRLAGTHCETSDLDILLFYTGKVREDDLFNALNRRDISLEIDGIPVDFNPVHIGKF